MRSEEFLIEELEEGWKSKLAAAGLAAAGMLSPAQAKDTVDSPDVNKPSIQSVQQDKIDYRKQGPITKDSMGQKLEYGIPVTDDGKFKAPNKEAWYDGKMSDKEYHEQLSAYKKWRADFTNRWPSATFNDDGSAKSSVKPGLAPMFPGKK